MKALRILGTVAGVVLALPAIGIAALYALFDGVRGPSLMPTSGGNEDRAMKPAFLGLAGTGGQGLDQVKGLTIPLSATGPFESLSCKIEFGSLVSEAAKTKVEEKKEEIKSKVGDKARDKLKGLFGK